MDIKSILVKVSEGGGNMKRKELLDNQKNNKQKTKKYIRILWVILLGFSIVIGGTIYMSENNKHNFDSYEELHNKFMSDEISFEVYEKHLHEFDAEEIANIHNKEGYEKNIESQSSERSNIVTETGLERKIGEKPENSSWDGAVSEVINYLEDNLRNPKSLDFVESSPVDSVIRDGKYYWRVRHKYGAENAFGGTVTENQVFYIRNGEVVKVFDY